MSASAPEVVHFLRERPPFNALTVDDVQRLAAAVEVERYPAGATIFSQGAQPIEHLRVVRSGAV